MNSNRITDKHNKNPGIQRCHIITAFIILILFLSAFMVFTDETLVISRFLLPFKDKDARYFFSHKDSLYLGNHPERTLYKVNTRNTLEKVEDLKNWYIVDAWPFRNHIFYCSRQRILYKESGSVRTIPVKESVNLISITSDEKVLYLLDKRENDYIILVLDADFNLKNTLPSPGRQPSDIVYYKNALWVYDIKSRSVHKLNLETNETEYIIYTGADNCYSEGILFFNDRLYIHNRGSSSLDLVEFTETDNAILSLPHSISYQYTIDCRNLHTQNPCKAEFRIPIPRDSPEQQVTSLKWKQYPMEIQKDFYDQDLAVFTYTLKPGEHLSLSYKADITLWAVRYKLKEMPLSSLASLPDKIKESYLAHDTYFSMDSAMIKHTASKAQLNSKGKEPGGVKELIENITDYITDSLSYTMDDNWDHADKILNKKRGSCSEYSFLFSALARLNNIPTRLAGGFIFGREEDSFHRWTEIYYPGTGWVPVDVTAIDSDNPDSLDYEFLFGKPQTRFVFSLMGGIDNTLLDVEYYGYKRFSGGTRERKITVKTISIEPLYSEKTEIRVIQGPSI